MLVSIRAAISVEVNKESEATALDTRASPLSSNKYRKTRSPSVRASTAPLASISQLRGACELCCINWAFCSLMGLSSAIVIIEEKLIKPKTAIALTVLPEIRDICSNSTEYNSAENFAPIVLAKSIKYRQFRLKGKKRGQKDSELNKV